VIDYLFTYPYSLYSPEESDAVLVEKNGYLPMFRDYADLRRLYSNPEEILYYEKEGNYYQGNGTIAETKPYFLTGNPDDIVREDIIPFEFTSKDLVTDYANNLFKYGLYLRGWRDGNLYDYRELRDDLAIKRAFKNAEKSLNLLPMQDRLECGPSYLHETDPSIIIFQACVILLKCGQIEPLDRYLIPQ
jgi:hypothetical protein